MACYCDTCGKEMNIGVQVNNTNIAFIVLSGSKIYENDDRPLMVCFNRACDKYGVVVINPSLIENRLDILEQETSSTTMID